MQNTSLSHGMDPVLLTPSANLSIEAYSDHLALTAGPQRHYEVSYSQPPGRQEERWPFRFHMHRDFAINFLERLSNPSSDSSLVKRLVESASAWEYGYMGRPYEFRREFFDMIPTFGNVGFKILQDGDRTLVYLCQADIFEDSAKIAEALVQLSPQARASHLNTLNGILNSSGGRLEDWLKKQTLIVLPYVSIQDYRDC